MLSFGKPTASASGIGMLGAGPVTFGGGMRILLDECVPWPMHNLLSDHTCSSVQAKGWSGITNGDLLQRAEGEFDLFITSDQNIRYQQNLTGRRIAILELSTNDIGRIQAARILIEETIATLQSNEFKQLTIP